MRLNDDSNSRRHPLNASRVNLNHVDVCGGQSARDEISHILYGIIVTRTLPAAYVYIYVRRGQSARDSILNARFASCAVVVVVVVVVVIGHNIVTCTV